MDFEIFPSGSGDCVLVTSSDGKRLLADAGLPEAYDRFIAAPLSKLRAAQQKIDLVYVSHIDRDHIGGVLRMFDHEVQWRAHEHSRANGGRLREPKVPRPPEVLALWHNAFLEDVQRTEAIDLGTALGSSATMLSGLGAALPEDHAAAAVAAEARMLALSVGDAIELNWRAGPDQLGIPLNEPEKGGLLTAASTVPSLGTIGLRVLGPTNKQLAELREEWVAWLRKNEKQLERLRKRHQADADALASNADPRALAELSRELALAVEKDVTPPNLASLVLLLTEADGTRALLTGDAGDESLLDYLEAAKLLDEHGGIFVELLKVPHHGAHNSFSKDFVRRVRARHLVFCGDGEHHNPEPEVVQGYIDAVKADPLPNGEKTVFWFNWSSEHPTEFLDFWKQIEALFERSGVAACIERRSLGKDETSMKLTL